MIFNSSAKGSSFEVIFEKAKKNPDVNWFLWRLNAQNDKDIADLTQFASLVKKQANGEIPLPILTEWGITPHRSRMIAALLKEKLAATSDKEIGFWFPRIDKENIIEFESKLGNYYHSLMQANRIDALHFPSSYFYLIDEEICISVSVQDLGWKNFNSPAFEHKLIEITFPRFHIPPVLTVSVVLDDLIAAARGKIINKLAHTAAENNEFFSRYIKFDGFSIKTRFPVLFESDLFPIKNRKGQDYQFSYTQIFLEKIFAKTETAAEYMEAINFEAYSDLDILFSPSKRENYDFIQSFLIYKGLALPQSQTNKKTLEKINNKLLGSLRFYMTEEEIKEQIKSEIPDGNEEFCEKIFSEFRQSIIEKEKQKSELTVLFFTVDFYGNRETIYIHAANFNRYINKILGDAADPIEKQIRIDWKKKLSKYHFDPEMFSVNRFNALLFELIRRRDSVFGQILCQKKCIFYLNGLKKLNQFAAKLVLFGIENMAETLKLDPHKIYSQTVEEIKKEKSFFGRLIFKFFNWYYLRAYQNMKEQPTIGEDALTKSEIGQAPILTTVGVSSVSQIDEQCNRIWGELGADQIPRHSLESNIKTDLLEYFKNRDRIAPSGLEIIFERNANRIIKKAPHLAVYREKLFEFIKLYAYKIIALTPSLRAKFQSG